MEEELGPVCEKAVVDRGAQGLLKREDRKSHFLKAITRTEFLALEPSTV